MNVSDGSDAAKTAKQNEESGGVNISHVGSSDPTPNIYAPRDIVAPNPVRQGSSLRAARNALKEAKNLKHLADRLKVSLCSSFLFPICRLFFPIFMIWLYLNLILTYPSV